MSGVETYINLFLKTELTVIPRIVDKYIGNYYNNTLCNGATWMFVTWFIIHVIFDDLLNGLLRRMKVREYIRIRLQSSLWYLGFYTTAFMYSSATLLRNDIRLVAVNEPVDGMTSPCGHLVLGFIVVFTFYLHSIFWAKIKNHDTMLALIHLNLSLLMFASYFLRFVEGIFRLTIFICSTQVVVELARCTALTKRDAFKGALITRSAFIACLVTLYGGKHGISDSGVMHYRWALITSYSKLTLDIYHKSYIALNKFVEHLIVYQAIVWLEKNYIFSCFLSSVILILGFSIFNYLMLIPLLLGYPLIKRFSISGFFLWVCLSVWLLLEIYTSVLFKAISHWLNHTKDDETACEKDIFECSLFPPRSDVTYNYCILRREMMEREEQSLLLRKPKARNMVFQTLKCMVAIKRKLNEKRQNVNNVHDDNSANDTKSPEKDNSSNNVVVVDNAEEEEEEIVGGKLEFNINSKTGEEHKFKTE